MVITLRMWTVNVSDQWCQRGGYWTSHTFLSVLKIQQSLWLRWFLLKVAFSNSILQCVWQLNWCPCSWRAHVDVVRGHVHRFIPTKALLSGVRQCHDPWLTFVGRTRSVTLGRQCVTPTHTLTDGPGMMLRAVIIQNLTESVVLSWRLHSWAHKGTLAMWYKWLAYFALV